MGLKKQKFFETSVIIHQSPWHNIPEDLKLQQHWSSTLNLTYVDKLLRFPAGKYLWSSVTGYSYAIMFGINASLLLAAILYTLWRLKWRTTESQQPLPCNILGDFFDFDHVVQSVKAVVKKRPGNRRLYLLILFIAMALYTFQRGQSAFYYSIST